MDLCYIWRVSIEIHSVHDHKVHLKSFKNEQDALLFATEQCRKYVSENSKVFFDSNMITTVR